VFKSESGTDYSMGSVFPMANGLRMEFPQLKNVASIFAGFGSQVTTIDPAESENKKFLEDGLFFAEPQFFSVFNFPWISGEAGTALSEPNTVALTESTAQKYFGNWKEALGKNIKVGSKTVCKVTGIIKDPPVNTDFPLRVVLSMATSRNVKSTDWVTSYSDLNTFVVLPDNESEATFNGSLARFAKKHKPEDFKNDGFLLQPLNTIHSDSRFGNYNRHTFSKGLVNALSLIGIFLLVIACVNFINLATAQAIKRAKEVGVRKVLGSSRKQLVIQFLAETFLISLTSILAAICIAAVFLPLLNQLLQASIVLTYSPVLIGFLFLLLFAVTILSGFYPAIILSGFSPITALKNKITNHSGSLYLRKALVVFQFAIAQALIIGTLVIVGQMDFFKNAPMGFDKDAVVTVPVPTDSLSRTKYDALKADLLKKPGIKMVSYSMYVPSETAHWETEFKFDNAIKIAGFPADMKLADADYFRMYKMPFVAGRPYGPSDTVNEIVVNEMMVKKLGLKDPSAALGKLITFNKPEITAPIVGVVKDFNNYTFEQKIQPVISASRKRSFQIVNIKIETSKTPVVLASIEKTWKAAFPENVYKYQFLDDKIADYYKDENKLATLYKVFAGIAIFISCLGLYGLVTFMAEQRRKEVGVRKVLGASVANIIYLFSREFAILMAIAFVIASPVAYYFMNDWLQNYTYRIEPGIGIFILTIIISMIIVAISIGYRSIRAAVANPVSNLRTE
jgi:ABC-type antimicrobial peptide transport system permease subunit